jgi:hypothetical protein
MILGNSAGFALGCFKSACSMLHLRCLAPLFWLRLGRDVRGIKTWTLPVLLGLPGLLVLTTAAHTQTADVISPGEDGDFRSLQIPGPRGSYLQRFWLVVDRDPRGLWCRDLQGRPSIALKYGSVIESDSSAQAGEAVLLNQGKTYLRVKVKPINILYDARLRRNKTSFITCVVRANSSFLAPINPDSMGAVRP